MGLREVLTGRRKLKGPAPDRLFAITTAAVTLEAGHGISSAHAAAIVFQELSTSEFDAALHDTEEVVRATCADSGIVLSSQDDEFGYRWMVLRGGGIEDLAVGINAVSGSLEGAGLGDRLLCAVFAFLDSQNRRLFFIYNYKRGLWYPFAPVVSAGASRERATQRELELKAVVGDELPLEPELERWFPLWGTPL